MAGKKRSGLDKIGAALLALAERRGDVSSGAAPLPLYNPEAHIHLPRRRQNPVAMDALDDKPSPRRAS